MYTYRLTRGVQIYLQEEEGNNPVMTIGLFPIVIRCALLCRRARWDAHAHTCAEPPPMRVWLYALLCVSPSAWQMHLLHKSWWILSVNSKSKPYFASPLLALCRLSARRWLTRRRWRACCIRSLSPPHVDNCLMNGCNVFLFIYLII